MIVKTEQFPYKHILLNFLALFICPALWGQSAVMKPFLAERSHTEAGLVCPLGKSEECGKLASQQAEILRVAQIDNPNIQRTDVSQLWCRGDNPLSAVGFLQRDVGDGTIGDCYAVLTGANEAFAPLHCLMTDKHLAPLNATRLYFPKNCKLTSYEIAEIKMLDVKDSDFRTFEREGKQLIRPDFGKDLVKIRLSKAANANQSMGILTVNSDGGDVTFSKAGGKPNQNLPSEIYDTSSSGLIQVFEMLKDVKEGKIIPSQPGIEQLQTFAKLEFVENSGKIVGVNLVRNFGPRGLSGDKKVYPFDSSTSVGKSGTPHFIADPHGRVLIVGIEVGGNDDSSISRPFGASSEEAANYAVMPSALNANLITITNRQQMASK